MNQGDIEENDAFNGSNFYPLDGYVLEYATTHSYDDNNIIDCVNQDRIKPVSQFNRFFESLTTRITKLHLSDENNNAIYKIISDSMNESHKLINGLCENDPQADPRQIFDSSVQFICGKLDEHATSYKRTKKFQSNELFVAPQEKTLGMK